MLTDTELDALVARGAPVADEDLARIPLETLRPTPPRRRRRLARPLAGAFAAAALAVGGVFVVAAGDGEQTGTAWAAPLVKLANNSPLLLLDAPGWKVTRADEYDEAPSEVVEGEMTFTDAAGRNADLHWRAGDLRDWQKDRAHDAPLVRQREVLGQRAQVSRYAQSNDYTALWRDGERVLEFRTQAASLAEFERLLGALERVDVDAWLSAMPASVIKSADRATVVREMLADIAQPPGFDAKKLEQGELLKDRYQLGAAVAGAVACAWIARWDAARKRGDDATATAAAAAMQGSRDWKILGEMKADGDYPEVLWDYADAMRGGDGTWYGRPLLKEIQSGLGC